MGAVRICALTVTAVAAAAVLVPAASAQAATCAPAEHAGGDWPFYSGTLDGHRTQTAETTIGADNVSGLGLAWQLETPDGGVIHSTPTVAGGCVFFGTDLGTVTAANADTGEVVWTRKLSESSGSSYFEGAGIVGAPAVADGLVYVGATTDTASVLSALDQGTGEVVWASVVDEDPGGGLDSSPVPFDGMVFQAFKGDESSNHSNPGFVFVDAVGDGAGEILAKTHVIPAEDFEAGDRGGSIVNTPAVDLERKLLFAGTGNPASPRQNPRTNSLLKIDADRGSPTFGDILASHRGTSDSYPAPQDVESPACTSDLQWPIGRFTCAEFDFNFLASPVIWEHSDGRRLFGELQKSGVFTTVDRDTMEQVWQVALGVPCFSCNLSSSAADESGIYVALTGGNLYSLNRDTGAIQWAVPLTGSFHYNGVSVANGVVYNVNDLGLLQAFDATDGTPLLTHPFAQDSGTPMEDMGNSSGLSIARNTVFVSSRSNSTSTLFAFKLGESGGGDPPPGGEPPPPPGELPPLQATIATGPGATYYGYLTPAMVTQVGGPLSYANGDAVRHDVVARDRGPDGQPLFKSELASLGQTVPVNGLENVESGNTYEFFCSVHPGMKGQLIVR